ncbi:hypothetical protein CCR75_002298 [Bremia lactucae]|uniref:Uncharacterized protein n=1 Tax=Bremia lactucae TaxID=4779 RepID=A0A976FGI8_BRELC|nr:hypothetical protein CCR75_002298 [Bremia lactucae]
MHERQQQAPTASTTLTDGQQDKENASKDETSAQRQSPLVSTEQADTVASDSLNKRHPQGTTLHNAFRVPDNGSWSKHCNRNL